MDRAILLGLILHELVSNAVKHAFTHQVAGEVRVDLRSTDGAVRLEVADDGVGIPEVRSTDGAVRLEVADDGVGIPEEVDWQTPTTLGIQLVQGLAQQLGGSIELDRHSGTTVVVTFPLVSEEDGG
jgi:two-component sensor histidine kinase